MATAKLEEYWHQLRVANPNLPGVHRLKVARDAYREPVKGGTAADLGPMLSEALEEYFRHKGKAKSKVFFNVNRQACGYLVDVAGDKELGGYTRVDALAFRDGLKDWRRVATQYDRCPKVFLSARALAVLVLLWL